MSTTLQAADWSVYQRAHTYADMVTLKDAGIELIIPGAWHGGSHNPNCRQDLLLAREAGLYTGTYAIVTGDGEFSVNKAYEVCGPEWEHLRFVAIDMELAGGSVAQVQKALDHVRALGQEPIIYTAYWFWHDVFGNPDAFRHEWLWNAYYDQQPDIDFASLPYGGWTQAKVIGEQYIGTHTYKGMVMDRSTFSRAAIESLHEENIPTPEPEPEEDMKLQIVKTEGAAGTFWWLTTYPRAWRIWITNLHYAEYMQEKGGWPKQVTTLTHNENEIFKGIPRIGEIPDRVN